MKPGKAAGTSGGKAVTTGFDAVEAIAPQRLKPIVCIVWAALAASACVNALTRIDELHTAGQSVAQWEPWVWEGSSALLFAALVPVIALAVVEGLKTGMSLPRRSLIHLTAFGAVCLAHVFGMIALREAFYVGMGARYDFGLSWSTLLYEARKDAVTYVLIAALIWMWLRLRSPPRVADDTAPPLVVRDGARTIVIDIATIGYVEAAGNYVEVHCARGVVLARSSLAAVERQLELHGFVRIHRSRLVRLAAITTATSTASGDFELVLDDGSRVAGSRRYRECIRHLRDVSLQGEKL